ncbi:MAG: hypothetical protein ACYSSL_01585 [Planctomycetota bacterium]|jgi:hypothetical protein
MQYPADCVTAADKMEYLYAAQEKLRKLYNVFAVWSNQGLTQQLYDNLSVKIQNKYPYVAKLDVADFKKFVAEDMEPRSQRIFDGIAGMREQLKTSIRWDIAVEDI